MTSIEASMDSRLPQVAPRGDRTATEPGGVSPSRGRDPQWVASGRRQAPPAMGRQPGTSNDGRSGPRERRA